MSESFQQLARSYPPVDGRQEGPPPGQRVRAGRGRGNVRVNQRGESDVCNPIFQQLVRDSGDMDQLTEYAALVVWAELLFHASRCGWVNEEYEFAFILVTVQTKYAVTSP